MQSFFLRQFHHGHLTDVYRWIFFRQKWTKITNRKNSISSGVKGKCLGISLISLHKEITKIPYVHSFILCCMNLRILVFWFGFPGCVGGGLAIQTWFLQWLQNLACREIWVRAQSLRSLAITAQGEASQIFCAV